MIKSKEEFNLSSQKAIEHLKLEFGKVRAGRPSTEIVASIKVEAYGSMVPLDQVASLSVQDSNMIIVSPWDKSLLEAVQKAIQKSELGINPVVDKDFIRLVFPPRTEEKRKEYVKLCSQKSEEAKIVVRQLRKEYLQNLDEQKKSNVLTEDGVKQEEKKLQLLVDENNKQIDELLKQKEKALLTL